MKNDGKTLIDMFKVRVNWTPRGCIRPAVFHVLSHKTKKKNKIK